MEVGPAVHERELLKTVCARHTYCCGESCVSSSETGLATSRELTSYRLILCPYYVNLESIFLGKDSTGYFGILGCYTEQRSCWFPAVAAKGPPSSSRTKESSILVWCLKTLIMTAVRFFETSGMSSPFIQPNNPEGPESSTPTHWKKGMTQCTQIFVSGQNQKFNRMKVTCLPNYRANGTGSKQHSYMRW